MRSMNAIFQMTHNIINTHARTHTHTVHTVLSKGIKYYDALKIMNEKGKAFLSFEVHEHEHGFDVNGFHWQLAYANSVRTIVDNLLFQFV